MAVGYDSSPSAREAVRFAADAAWLRERRLAIVCARRPAMVEAAEDLALEAAALAEPFLPTARIALETPDMSAADALTARSRSADLLVVGRGRLRPHRIAFGSVAEAVIARAGCPVVVVGESPGRHVGGAVLVGVDLADPDRALGAAFAEAWLRGCPVIAVHAWEHPDGPIFAYAEPSRFDAEAAWGEDLRQLTDVLAPFRNKYPGVHVEARTVHGSAADVLVRHAAQAGLVVVGSNAHGPMGRAVLGSVGRQLVHRLACPVLIARPHHHAA